MFIGIGVAGLAERLAGIDNHLNALALFPLRLDGLKNRGESGAIFSIHWSPPG
jgi:hypothetical protein